MKVSISHVMLLRGVSRVARLVGVSQGHLSRVLRGERKPSRELARKLERMGVEIPKEGAV